MEEKHFSRPLIPLSISFMTGVFLGDILSGYGKIVAGTALVLSLLLIRNLIFRRESLWLPILLFVSLGYLSLQCWASPRLPDNYIFRFADKFHRRISGVVLTDPIVAEGRMKFIFMTDSLGKDQDFVQGRLRVTGPAGETVPEKGDRIVFSGRIRIIRNFRNPNGFDYQRYMAFRKIQCSAYARKGSLVILEKGERKDFSDRLTSFQKTISDVIRCQTAGSARHILQALIIGDRNHLPDRLRNQFNRAGVAHLLAISGLHMSIVSGLFFFIFRSLFSLWTPLLLRGRLNGMAALLTLVPLTAYGMISGLSPPTQRAMLMACVCLLALISRNDQESFNTLALAGLVILVIHPPLFFTASFRFSFMAVLAILYGFVRLMPASPRPSPLSAPVRWLMNLTAISIFAILGVMPLTMTYFYQISWIGVIANPVFIPLIGFITVPLGLFSAFLYPMLPAVAETGLHLCGIYTEQVLKLIPYFADFPLGFTRTFSPTVFEVILYYGLLWAAAERFGPSRSGTAESGNMRRIAGGMMIVILTAGILNGGYWTIRRYFPGSLRISIIDVGQGSACLAEFPGGETMLIDGGGFYNNRIFDVGKSIVGPYLLHRRVMTVDTLVLTHADADHINGLFHIINSFHIGKIWITDLEAKERLKQAFLEQIDEKKIPADVYHRLRRKQKIGDAAVEILYPPRDASMVNGPWTGHSNNASIVVKLTWKKHSVLFTGDIEKKAEKALLTLAAGKLKSTILVAPHHGCKTSGSEAFMDAVEPEWMLISCGRDNRFGCPHDAVLSRCRERSIRICRTDLNGSIQVEMNGDHYEVLPFDRN